MTIRPCNPELPPLFAPAAGIGPDADEVLLHRLAPEALLPVWSWRRPNVAEASALLAWMEAQPECWTLWGRLASEFGPSVLDRVIHRAFKEHRRKVAEDRQKEEDRREKAEQITLYYTQPKKFFGLELRRGDESVGFWSISFERRWERDRLCDWMRWQGDCFAEWREHVDEHGGRSLERLVTEAMLAAERKLKKRGLTVGGQRPLRFWRGDA